MGTEELWLQKRPRGWNTELCEWSWASCWNFYPNVRTCIMKNCNLSLPLPVPVPPYTLFPSLHSGCALEVILSKVCVVHSKGHPLTLKRSSSLPSRSSSQRFCTQRVRLAHSKGRARSKGPAWLSYRAYILTYIGVYRSLRLRVLLREQMVCDSGFCFWLYTYIQWSESSVKFFCSFCFFLGGGSFGDYT